MAKTELIQTVLTSPDSIVWEGEATSITSENIDGLFDLFPDHTRFMTLLEGVDFEVHLKDGKKKVFHIEKAVLFFQNAVAKVYLHKHIDQKSA